MPFIQFNRGEETKYSSQMYTSGPVTCLIGKKDNHPVYFVPHSTLLDLLGANAVFREISEQNLEEELSKGSFEYYQAVRKLKPEVFDETLRQLPPYGSVTLSFSITSDLLGQAQAILEEYNSSVEVSSDGYSAHLGADTTLVYGTHVTATLKKNDLLSLVEELSANQIAGYDEKHKIFVEKDPDTSS